MSIIEVINVNNLKTDVFDDLYNFFPFNIIQLINSYFFKMDYKKFKHKNIIHCVSLISNEKIIVGTSDGYINIIDLIKNKCVMSLYDCNLTIDYVNVNAPKYRKIISKSINGQLKLWHDYNFLSRFDELGPIYYVSVYEEFVIVKTFEGKVYIIDPCAVNIDSTMNINEIYENNVNFISPLPNKKLITQSVKKTIKIWCLKTGLCEYVIETPNVIECFYTFSNNLIIGFDKIMKLYNKSTELATFIGHANVIKCVTVYNNKIISGSYDKTIKIWDMYGNCEFTLIDSDTICYIIPLTNKRILCGTYKEFKIWNLENRKWEICYINRYNVKNIDIVGECIVIRSNIKM